MYFLLYIVLIIVLYVKSFKESFNEEQIQKVTPVLFLVSIAMFALAVFASIMGN